MSKSFLSEIIRFVFAGTIVAILHLAFVYFLTSVLGIWYQVSTTFSYLCAFILNFLLQKYFVRKDRDVEINRIKTQLLAYVGATLIVLGLNLFLMYIFVSIFLWHYLLAQALVLLLLSLTTFSINRNLIFR